MSKAKEYKYYPELCNVGSWLLSCLQEKGSPYHLNEDKNGILCDIDGDKDIVVFPKKNLVEWAYALNLERKMEFIKYEISCGVNLVNAFLEHRAKIGSFKNH